MTTRGRAVATLACCAVFLWAAAGQASAAAGAELPPNVLIVVVDDLGWNDVGYHGSEIETPNIDAFVASGVELDRFYTAPWCAPTRVGLMTGHYPHRYGFRYGAQSSPAKSTGRRLGPDAALLPRVLAGAGYRRRGLVGKWHLDGARLPDRGPLGRGFTSFYGHLGGAIDYFQHTTPRTHDLDWYRDRQLLREAGYSTDLLAAEAERFIEARSQDSERFLLVLAFNAPHAPLQAKAADLAAAGAPQDTRGLGRANSADPKLDRRIFAAMVASLDAGIGRVLGALGRVGLQDETFVLFFSDNGGLSAAGADNAPLRGQKNTTWEGGVRVPAAVRWPGVLPTGRKLEEVVSYIDVLPTLCRVTGAAPPEAGFDGSDAFDLLRGERVVPERTLYLGAEAVVSRDWKLVGDRLYRIRQDPGETRDVAGEHPEVAARLRSAIERAERLERL